MASLEILTPVRLLLNMFKMGVDSLQAIARKEAEKAEAPNQKEDDNKEEANGNPDDKGAASDDFPMGSPLAGNKTEEPPTAFPFEQPDVNNVNCFVMMLDLILAQVGILYDVTSSLTEELVTCHLFV